MNRVGAQVKISTFLCLNVNQVIVDDTGSPIK